MSKYLKRLNGEYLFYLFLQSSNLQNPIEKNNYQVLHFYSVNKQKQICIPHNALMLWIITASPSHWYNILKTYKTTLPYASGKLFDLTNFTKV